MRATANKNKNKAMSEALERKGKKMSPYNSLMSQSIDNWFPKCGYPHPNCKC